MDSYKLFQMIGVTRGVTRDSDNAAIPFDMGNMDCRQFLADWQSGATLLDADDSPVAYSGEAAAALGLTE